MWRDEEKQGKHRLYRELEDLASEMNYTIDAVIVEGIHDKKTLNLLGYKKTIIVCSRRTHHELTDLIAKKFSHVVILTDFDKQGMVLYKKIASFLEKKGVEADRFYRRRFDKLLKTARIATIEGIYKIKLDLFSLHRKC